MLQGLAGIIVAIVAVILVWKIFKKLVGALLLGIALLLLLWYFGFLF